MGLQVSIIDNSKELLDAVETQIRNGLYAIGTTVEGYAKENCPVDTGRLRNSIAHREGKNYTEIGSDVEYAVAVEIGDSVNHKVGGSRYLKHAVEDHIDEYKDLLTEALKS